MSTLEAKAKQKVLTLINERQNEIKQFLSRIIQFKSINPLNTVSGELTENKALMEWLRNKFDETGCYNKIDMWEAQTDAPNLVGVVKGAGGGQSLMINAHADVVRVTDEQLKNWTGPGPWSGEEQGEKIWGRGAVDDKSGVTIMYWTSKLIHEAGIKLKGDLTVAINSCEEIAAKDWGPRSIVDRGYRAPLLLIAEGSNLKINHIGIGLCYFRLTVQGKSVHNSRRGRCIYPLPYGETVPGVNAIEKMVKYMHALQDLEESWGLYNKHPFVPSGSMHIGISIINGGEYKAAVPEKCEGIYGVYFIQGFTGNQVMEEVKKTIDCVTQNDYWLRKHPPTIEYPVIEPLFEPYEVPRDHPGCKKVAQIIKDVTGHEAIFGMAGPGDSNWFSEKGIPTLVVGPGGGGTHGANEYVNIDTLMNALKVYVSMIITWCEVEDIA